METSILNSTQRYASCALFALALNQSQHHQWRLTTTLPPPDEEPIGSAVVTSAAAASTVSDRPHLWIHQDSGLLFPVFKFLRVDDKAWDGLKETAGSSSQISHHVASFINLLSDESVPTSETCGKELGLLKAVEAMVSSLKAADSTVRSVEELKDELESVHGAETVSDKATEIDRIDISIKEQEQDTCESPTCERPVKDAESLSCHRKVTVLYELLSACLLATTTDRKNDLNSVKGYDSRHRVALRLLATWLDVKWIQMEALEVILACSIMDIIRGEIEKRDTSDPSEPWKKGGMIGAAAVAGGALLAATGGVLAPAVAQGLGAVAPTLGGLLPAIGVGGFAAAATAIGSVSGTIAIAASFGAAGAGLCGSKMARRIGDIEDFKFNAFGDNHMQGRLAVGIMVSGLVFEEADYVRPWESQNVNLERYGLHWEYNNLAAVSTAVRDLIASKITTQLISVGAMLTVIGAVMAALAVPTALISASDIIDSKWAIALDRSDKAGKLLAEVLLEGHHGHRPVTFIGFSLGARVIFKCLQCLAESEGDNAGIVERVVLLGAPISLKDENWPLARKMVSGRFVNAYSTNDWTLGIAFRSNLVSQGLAGIQPVDAFGIENVDVTQIIESHSSYMHMTDQIVKQLELDTYHPVWITGTCEMEISTPK
ncbi:transmembrane and coiled-coil domain-containing protein STS1-like [Silene latifolia]|uniref:transmembrane and coiled-coil domain-containing protein STS1-like n=1 Tax=Silene latifolia TaxID=37657 RepID=UPI003D7840C9